MKEKSPNACMRNARRFIEWAKPDEYGHPQRKENCPTIFCGKPRVACWKKLGEAFDWNEFAIAGVLWAITNLDCDTLIDKEETQ